MRLANSCSSADHSELKKFADWILDIGDGNIGDSDEGDATIQIPPYLLLNVINDPISTIVHATYHQLLQNLNNPPYFKERAILAPTHVIVDDVNEYMLHLMPGEEKIYLSADGICKSDARAGFNASVYSSDYLHSIRSSGLPNHVLKLKVGVPVMLLRNIDQSSGLCNGTRLMITRLGTRIIEAQIISGRNIGEKVAIPRMVLSPSDSTLPFKFQRRQFPIILSFGMTINKSQGQSLSHVGLYLPKPVFTHGQLYVALSRVTSIQGLKVLLLDKYGKSVTETKNVVYKEVLQNI